MRRKIISIDHELCNGCGICVTSCPEGALQLIDGKARLVGDLLCDGLGACLKDCPQNAISVEEREAEPYDELKVLKNIIPQGANVLLAHLKHLQNHGQTGFLQQALAHLKSEGVPIELPSHTSTPVPVAHSCPGSQNKTFSPCSIDTETAPSKPSQLNHWPIQLHLISPTAPQYQKSDLLVAADCTAFSNADFHNKFLKGHSLIIACPKLDANQDIYREKLIALIDQAKVKSIKVMIMQVPCCGGLLRQVMDAAKQATLKPPIISIVVGLQGEILNEVPVEIS
jgi:NAD-dependent dihydropyrimidine dehydrogenase PreA subunit